MQTLPGTARKCYGVYTQMNLVITCGKITACVFLRLVGDRSLDMQVGIVHLTYYWQALMSFR